MSTYSLLDPKYSSLFNNNNEKKEFNHSVKAVKSLTTLSNKLLNKKNKK